MPRFATEIPAAPVLVPLLLVAVAAGLWWLVRQRALTGPRAAVGVVACLYGAAVLRAVLFPFAVNTGAFGNDVAWWEYVQFVPLLTADPTGIVLNLALFVPFGLLLPLVGRVRTVRSIAGVAFLVSLAVESVQLVGDVTVSTGRVFDVDDLIANTVGALVGFGVLRAAVRIPVVADLVTAVTWPAPRTRARGHRQALTAAQR